MKITLPRVAPRNPLVAPARHRHAGPHGLSRGAQRQKGRNGTCNFLLPARSQCPVLTPEPVRSFRQAFYPRRHPRGLLHFPGGTLAKRAPGWKSKFTAG